MALGGRRPFTRQHGLSQKPSTTCCSKCNFQHQGGAYILSYTKADSIIPLKRHYKVIYHDGAGCYAW